MKIIINCLYQVKHMDFVSKKGYWMVSILSGREKRRKKMLVLKVASYIYEKTSGACRSIDCLSKRFRSCQSSRTEFNIMSVQ